MKIAILLIIYISVLNSSETFLYSGLSGLALRGAKTTFPPEFHDKSRLEYYASLFNSIEINSSFYKTPQAATVAKWAASVPDKFKFTFKLSKAITHVKELEFNDDDIGPFMKVIDAAAEKKGCLLIQFPPSIKIEKLDRLQSLLSEFSFFNEAKWKLAVEFRHASWYEREVYEILEEHDATVVLQDIPKSATPPDLLLGDTIYLRFHGPGGGYRGCYSDECLARYAGCIRDWHAGGKTVYVYFNNTMGDAVKNLQTLNSMSAK